MRWFSGRWGELRVYADEALPPILDGIAEVPAWFGARFRPALLRFPLKGERPDGPYVAVWPDDGTLPDLTGGAVEAPDDLAGVVLAELCRHRCFVCSARFTVIYPDGAIPVLGRNLDRHRTMSGCPACGSDFGRSRVGGLALIQSR